MKDQQLYRHRQQRSNSPMLETSSSDVCSSEAVVAAREVIEVEREERRLRSERFDEDEPVSAGESGEVRGRD